MRMPPDCRASGRRGVDASDGVVVVEVVQGLVTHDGVDWSVDSQGPPVGVQIHAVQGDPVPVGCQALARQVQHGPREIELGVTNVGKFPQEVSGEETWAASKLEHVRGRYPRLPESLRHVGEIRLTMLIPGLGFPFPGAAVFHIVKSMRTSFRYCFSGVGSSKYDPSELDKLTRRAKGIEPGRAIGLVPRRGSALARGFVEARRTGHRGLSTRRRPTSGST